jgi:HSP20 family protein
MATTRQQTGEDTRASQGRGETSREMQRREQGPRGMQQRRQQSGANLMSPFGLGPFGLGPFSLMRRMQEDIDRMLSNTLLGQGQRDQVDAGTADVIPAIETLQRGNEFVIRMDLPGVDIDNVEIDVGDDTVNVRGERRIERENERDGVYVSEVAYGAFERVIPLPQGAVTDDATARLVNGVLEIVVPAPSKEAQRGRRLDVQRGSTERGSTERSSTERSSGERGSGERAEGGQRRS